MALNSPAVQQLSEADRERCRYFASMAPTPCEASNLHVVSDSVLQYWSLETLDPAGRVCLLRYRGVEVKIYYRRQAVGIVRGEEVRGLNPGEWLAVDLMEERKETVLKKELAAERRGRVLAERLRAEEKARHLRAEAVWADKLNAALAALKVLGKKKGVGDKTNAKAKK
jgi:hypothetical protein